MILPNIKKLSLILFLFVLFECDSKKENPVLNDPIRNLLCYGYNICSEPSRGTEFGLIGDSWTDIIGGAPLVWTLRTYMENKYEYKLTATTLAGRTLENVYNQGLHYNIIESAGPDLRYMVLSLGGNDLLYNYPHYSANLAADKQVLFDLIRSRLLAVVRSGNLYKRQKWGGGNLIWIIHGYDYINPDMPQSILINGCREVFIKYGYPSDLIIPDLVDSIDRLNQTMQSASYEEPSLRYVNLRKSLGGPPVSSSSLLTDCIHPNSAGFDLITAIFVKNLDFITGHAR